MMCDECKLDGTDKCPHIFLKRTVSVFGCTMEAGE